MQKNKERKMLVKEVEKEVGKKGGMLLTTTAKQNTRVIHQKSMKKYCFSARNPILIE
jgi:hypothetical protein